MTKEEQKAAIRPIILNNDAFTSNHIHDILDAMDLIIDNGADSGGEGGIDTVLAINQALTADRTVNLNTKTLNLGDGTLDNGAVHIGAILLLSRLVEYANNAAALAGGVPNNGAYYTVSGDERIIKIAHD